MAKRVRQFLTPEARRSLIAAALVAAGYKQSLAYETAHTIDIKMPINGVRNFSALAKEIREKLSLAVGQQRADLSVYEPGLQLPIRSGLRVIQGGRR
jgi:hypothetical protein